SDNVSQHLAYCRECAARSDELFELRRALLQLPAAAPSPRLAMRLRVLASHERERRLSRSSFSAAVRDWSDRAKLVVDNLMRPLALPFAGGVLSALFLFSMLVPTLGFPHNFRNDVPTALCTQASLEEVTPFGINNDETVVELTIDDRGQITDYSIPLGKISP